MFDINKFKEIDKLLKKSQNSAKIVAISKNHPLESVLEAIKNGVNIFWKQSSRGPRKIL